MAKYLKHCHLHRSHAMQKHSVTPIIDWEESNHSHPANCTREAKRYAESWLTRRFQLTLSEEMSILKNCLIADKWRIWFAIINWASKQMYFKSSKAILTIQCIHDFTGRHWCDHGFESSLLLWTLLCFHNFTEDELMNSLLRGLV